jgi:DNA mismatch repair protein MutS
MTQTDGNRLTLAFDQTSPGEFQSILFGTADVDVTAEAPAFFRDLNLDQVVDAVVAGRDEYELRPFFHTTLGHVDAVAYRHEVFRDLQNEDVREAVGSFAEQMQRVRRYLKMVETQRYKYEKERWALDAATLYHETVSAFTARLGELELSSRGLKELEAFLTEYGSSDDFASLVADTRAVLGGLDGVRYTMRINGARVTVSKYQDEPDYSVEVEKTFERFRQGAPDDHLVKVPDSGAMDHVEAQIVSLVARLYPDEFASLDAFCERHRTFLHPLVMRFDREVQFYLAYLQHEERLEGSGITFCYPAVSSRSKETSVVGGVDLALATAMYGAGGELVPNDFQLDGEERILVVSGPNNGGKTTFARMFGQLHYLAGLGIPVPAREARLFLPDAVFTHFERQEQVATLHGKLDDELIRVKEILERATRDSVIVLNEIFASTTLDDAVFLGTDVLTQVLELDCLGVCVTFVDELSTLSPATVSMVATVVPDDPSQRTFRIIRQIADGRAYASALAAKYGLSYERLKERLAR